MNKPAQPDGDSSEERPPIFRTWGRMYLAVIVNLILLIVFFYLITGFFS
jgi:hypothetical protein